MIKQVEATESGFRRNYENLKQCLLKLIIQLEQGIVNFDEVFHDPYLELSSIKSFKNSYELKYEDLKQKMCNFAYLDFDMKRNKFTPHNNTKTSITLTKSLGKLDLHQDYLNLEADIQNVIVCDFSQAKVDILNLNTNYVIKSLMGHTDTVKCVCLYEYNGSTKVISGSLDLTIKIWDLVLGVCLKTFYAQAKIISLKLLTNDRLAAGLLDSSIQIFELETGICLEILKGNFY
jgi:WD40 repeat protein